MFIKQLYQITNLTLIVLRTEMIIRDSHRFALVEVSSDA